MSEVVEKLDVLISCVLATNGLLAVLVGLIVYRYTTKR